MSVLFCVCLIASNLFATKIISLSGINLPGAVVIFPVAYILNDCIVEVWGYRKARLVIWTGFAMNFFVILAGKLVAWLPAASFWDGASHFDFIFNMAPRVVAASLLAFLVGSTLNSMVLSKMKIAEKGRHFGLRAILSSIVGEFADSMVFMPIVFLGTPVKTLFAMILAQVSFKVCYEVLILPITSAVVRKLKASEQVDVYDSGISYNPFRIGDI